MGVWKNQRVGVRTGGLEFRTRATHYCQKLEGGHIHTYIIGQFSNCEQKEKLGGMIVVVHIC